MSSQRSRARARWSRAQEEKCWGGAEYDTLPSSGRRLQELEIKSLSTSLRCSLASAIWLVCWHSLPPSSAAVTAFVRSFVRSLFRIFFGRCCAFVLWMSLSLPSCRAWYTVVVVARSLVCCCVRVWELLVLVLVLVLVCCCVDELCSVAMWLGCWMAHGTAYDVTLFALVVGVSSLLSLLLSMVLSLRCRWSFLV